MRKSKIMIIIMQQKCMTTENFYIEMPASSVNYMIR